MKKNLFARAAKAKVKALPDLPDRVEHLLRERLMDYLHLAKRAGLLIAGFEKVKDALLKKQVALLLQASDGSEDGKEKLARLCGAAPVNAWFSRAELEGISGQANTVHVALLPGGVTEKFMQESQRFAGFVTEDAV